MTDDSPIIRHRHGVTTQWTKRGYFGRIKCMCCGFSMIGENRTLHIRQGTRGIDICDDCASRCPECAGTGTALPTRCDIEVSAVREGFRRAP